MVRERGRVRRSILGPQAALDAGAKLGRMLRDLWLGIIGSHRA